ncbi:hypothetical protein [Pseudomonas oryzihabitans]|nr:hypothetical protein [Pseudomonas oryzihabitans]MXS21610.1 hypothetical protein [Pseudomonas oryzihabitans]
MDEIHGDKIKLLGMALAMMIVGLAALFMGVMLELSEIAYPACAKR